MTKFILTFVLFIVLASFDSLTYSSEQKAYSIVEILTPARLVYDDGLYRTVFSSFTIFDGNGNKILSSGEVFDFAARVKLPLGNYKIITSDEKGSTFVKDLTIEKEILIQITF